MIKPSSTSQRLHALQALRAYAAAMVVFVHAISTYFSKVDSTSSDTLQLHLGELGVKLFFCISGFIIFSSTKDLLPGFSSTAIFLKRRFIRVAPLYWLATIIYAIKLSLQGAHPSVTEFLYSLFFIPYIADNDLMRPVLGQGWSLNYEMFFYCLFGVSLFFQARWRILFMSLILLILMTLRNYELISLQGPLLERSLYLLSSNYLLYFLIGIAIAATKEGLSSFRVNISLPMKWSLILSTTLLGVYIFSEIYIRPEPVLSEIMMATTCSLCLFFCVLERKFIGRAGRFERLVELAGNASYSTYLFHGFLMGISARLIAATHLNVSQLFFALLMAFVCTFAGIIIYRFIEQPLLNKLR